MAPSSTASDFPNADYDDLPDLIGKLIRAAIDAYVRDKIAGEHVQSFVRNKDEYQMTFPSMTTYISRPGADGNGGGEGTRSSTWNSGPNYGGGGMPSKVDYTDEFNEVRATIRNIVKKWRKLPDPDEIDQVMVECRRAISPLSPSALSAGGKGTAGGLLQIKLSSVHDELTEMSGSTVETFKSQVIENLQHISSGLSAASIYWGAALGYEHGIFKSARKSVVDIIKKGIQCFDKVAQQSANPDIDTAIALGKLAKEGFTLFTGGGVISTIVGGVDLGLQTLKGLADDEKIPHTSESYDNAVNSLRSAFKALNKTIRDAENAVNKNLISNMAEMGKKKSSYDLKLAAIKSSDVNTSDKLRIDQSRVDNIMKMSRPVIIKELTNAQKGINNIHMTRCVNRPEHIGIGISGPSSKFHDYKWLLFDLLKELIKETENAFKNFEKAVEYIQQEDSTTKANLDAMEKDINRGSGLRPWQDRSIEKQMHDQKQHQHGNSHQHGNNHQQGSGHQHGNNHQHGSGHQDKG